MMVLPPVAGINAGHSTGGGLLDTFQQTIAGVTGGATGQTGQVDPGPKGDGSVGLFDGVLKKALFGGAAGAAMGFLPFIPGGPILGGVVGALGGAAMGVFSNWSKQKKIKADNEAMLAAMGVQVNDPQIQQVLKSGNVSQLIPMMQQSQQGGTTQVPVTQTVATQAPVTQTLTGSDVTMEEIQAAQQQAIAEGRTPGVLVTDPSTGGIAQSPFPTQGSVAVGSGAGGAINPAAGVNPGIAPAYASGGGGADDASSAADQLGEEPLASLEDAQIRAMIEQLQKQIDMLEDMIENDERRHAESLAAERSRLASRAA